MEAATSSDTPVVFNGLYGVMPQNTELFINTTVRQMKGKIITKIRFLKEEMLI
jgi:hypothetical protein